METQQAELSMEAQFEIALFNKRIDAITDINQLRALAKEVNLLAVMTKATATQLIGKQWGIIP